MLDSGHFQSPLARDRQHRAERATDGPPKRSLCKRIGWEEEEWDSADHKTHGLQINVEMEPNLLEAPAETVLRNNPCSLRDLAGD